LDGIIAIFVLVGMVFGFFLFTALIAFARNFAMYSITVISLLAIIYLMVKHTMLGMSFLCGMAFISLSIFVYIFQNSEDDNSKMLLRTYDVPVSEFIGNSLKAKYNRISLGFRYDIAKKILKKMPKERSY